MTRQAAVVSRLAGGGVLFGLLAQAAVAGDLFLAFPGADGFGRFASGWRGGEVVAVRNLEDGGAGSLRACAANGGRPRVCVFEVGGTIVLDTPIRAGSNLYLAGQTAPGEGVQLRLGRAYSSPILVERAHDVLIRFLKLRPGPGSKPSASVSAITVSQSHDVYLDRLSLAFATDQNLSIHAGPAPTHDVTVARSISAWALDEANHPLGPHSKGALICSQQQHRGACGRVSLIGNVFAHNRDRNPEVKASGLGPVEVIGNLAYNGKSSFVEVYNNTGDTQVNLIDNLAMPGPSTSRRHPVPLARIARLRPDAELLVHMSGNRILARCRGEPTSVRADDLAADFAAIHPIHPTAYTGGKGPPPEKLLREVGAASAAGPDIDALDLALIRSIRDCRGRIIDVPAEAGGWPALPTVVGPPDGDGDGMPDAWESARRGPDAARRPDAWAEDTSGWSRLEAYLAHLAGDPLPEQTTGLDQ